MSEVETWAKCSQCGTQFDVEQTECPTNDLCQKCWNELKNNPEKVVVENSNVIVEVESYEEFLIREQIMYADGVDDDEYDAWKSILSKVRVYNAEHE